jgi:DNA repair exonuclease SbcCD ATPase subunit
MAGPANPRQSMVILTQLRETQQRLQAQITKIENQLAQLEVYKIPDSQPYITLKWVSRVEELAAPNKPLRTALKEDLAELKKQLENLRQASRNLHLANPWIETLKAKRQALSTSTDIRRRLKESLDKLAQEQARGGSFDEEAIAGLVDEAEKNLTRLVEILKRNPTKSNARNALREMEIPLLLRGQCRTGACESAFDTLNSAGKKWVEEAKQKFKREPTVANAKAMLNDAAAAALIGYDDCSGVSDSLNEGAEKMRKNADQSFRRNPTVENFKAMEQADIVCGQLSIEPLKPSGMRQVAPGTMHEVMPGDTLAKISQRYFGSPGYWDVIYKNNRNVIKDPNITVPHTRLKIS